MTTIGFTEGLIKRLPAVRGRYSANAALDRVTWFRVGGPAEVMLRPEDADDLAFFLKNCPDDVDVTVLGVGSNLLVRDGGVKGVVVRLTKGFADISIDGDTILAGAGALDVNVARFAQQNNLGGLEFLSGIPGTIGGALRMNAGAYGGEMKDILMQARAITPEGEIKTLSLDDLGFSYRHSAIPEDWIFIDALLKGQPETAEIIGQRMDDISAKRGASQPIRSRTGGSTFANPEGHKAWQLIDAAGCRGLKIGGAQVSEQHCNFLINTGTATAADLENLGEEVRRRVKEQSDIDLRWEIRRIGTSMEDA